MIHSFWVPRLGGKRDQLPDHPNELVLEASKPGIYHGVCTEYCAGQHARMAFCLVAHAPEDFEQWVLKKHQSPRFPPEDPFYTGREVFSKAGCAACHSIAGLAEGKIGPDLTHIGSRLTLGAGQFDNTIGNLSGWVANPQALKPGNLMPPTYLSPEELHLLVSYLHRLE